MRAAVIALGLIVVALIARADQAPQRPRSTAPAGFDHARHAQATQVACAQCHPLERGIIAGVAGGAGAKAPSHATCFGKCHAEQAATLKLKDPVPDDRLRYCNACHAETALVVPVDKKALAQTAAKNGVEYGLQLGHNSHSQIACTKCHDPGRPRKGRPHDRCLACHGDKAEKTFAIAECEKCHPTGRDRPRLVRSEVLVTAMFSHAKHATRGTAKQCASCHAGVIATDARALPSPKVETCARGGCHDGKAAFGAMTSCTKCHQDAPKGEFKVARPDAVFSHARHEPHTKAPCAACHPLSKSGEVLVTGHLACVDGCHKHETEFGARAPTICGACHDGTEPWRPLIADKLPSDTTEFGATLDHLSGCDWCGARLKMILDAEPFTPEEQAYIESQVRPMNLESKADE